MQAATLAAPPDERAAVARTEAETIHASEDAASAAIALLGADLLAGSRRILTHCNTGALACGGTGSALAVAVELAERDDITVLACETRPLLQGARLTIWELRRAGIAHELLVDGAAAGLIRRGEIDAVIVGCDRVAANGDVANKVGTYAHALAARAAGIPFVVAGPTSTIDASIATGEEIVIEERDMDEVRHAGGALLTEAGTPCRNPAFDVTPAELVTALVTERGIASPVTTESVMALAGVYAGRPIEDRPFHLDARGGPGGARRSGPRPRRGRLPRARLRRLRLGRQRRLRVQEAPGRARPRGRRRGARDRRRRDGGRHR